MTYVKEKETQLLYHPVVTGTLFTEHEIHNWRYIINYIFSSPPNYIYISYICCGWDSHER